MGQNEWKYAFDRVFAVKRRFFFQTRRELFGNESNKNVIFRPGSPFLSWESGNSHRILMGVQPCGWMWVCFLTLTSR